MRISDFWRIYKKKFQLKQLLTALALLGLFGLFIVLLILHDRSTSHEKPVDESLDDMLSSVTVEDSADSGDRDQGEGSDRNKTTKFMSVQDYERWLKQPRVRNNVIVEAGIEGVAVTEFLLDKTQKAYFVGDTGTVRLRHPGNYDLTIQAGPQLYKSTLTVVDTLEPVVQLRDLIVPLGATLEAEAFVASASDGTPLSYRFITAADTSVPGRQQVEIQVEDLGEHRLCLPAVVEVAALLDHVTVEAGSANRLSEADFWPAVKKEPLPRIITNIKALEFNHTGDFPVEFSVDGKSVIAYVRVKDTVPPKAKAQPLTIGLGAIPDPEEFVSEIDDATTVTVTYDKMPDFNKMGEQDVSLVLTDEGKNTLKLKTVLKVVEDKAAPQLRGVHDLALFLGEERDFLEGVEARDNLDPNPIITVDRLAFELTEPGTYTLTYTATDRSANRTSTRCKVYVQKRPPFKAEASAGDERLNELADEVLATIIHGDMDRYQKAYAIYHWLEENLVYRPQAKNSGVIDGAINTLRTRSGNSSGYRYTQLALLSRAGLESTAIDSADGSHYWTLVRLDGRQIVSDPLWGYFDISPQEMLREAEQRALRRGTASGEAFTVHLETTRRLVPYRITRQSGHNLRRGQTQLLRKGENGIIQDVYQNTYRNGVLVERILLRSKIIKAVVPELIEVGSRENSSPVIEGVPEDLACEYGVEFNFLLGVSAYDAEDGELTVHVDKGNYKAVVPGTYRIVYSAVDREGARSESAFNLTVLPETTVSAATQESGETTQTETSETTAVQETTASAPDVPGETTVSVSTLTTSPRGLSEPLKREERDQEPRMRGEGHTVLTTSGGIS